MSNGDLLMDSNHKGRYTKVKDFVDRNFWTLIICGAIGGLVLLCVFGELNNRRIREERDRLTRTYLIDHKCHRTGFAGKDAVSVYQCDHGLWLYPEIYRFANPDAP